MSNLVKVRYISETTGEKSNREYTYKAEEEFQIGDIVMVPTRGSTAKAVVTTIDVPESEVEAFKDKLVTIPLFSLVSHEEPLLPEPTEFIPDAVCREITPAEEEAPKECRTIAIIDPMEDAEVRGCMDSIRSFHGKACALVVGSAAEQHDATVMLADIARLKKALVEHRTALLGPLKEQVSFIDSQFKSIMAPVEAADSILRKKILEYQLNERTKRDELDRIARLEREAAEAKAKLENKPAPAMPVPKQAEVKTHIDTGAGSATTAMITKYEVTDFAALPDRYKIADTAKLTREIKAAKGDISIPGVRIYQEPILKVRG